MKKLISLFAIGLVVGLWGFALLGDVLQNVGGTTSSGTTITLSAGSVGTPAINLGDSNAGWYRNASGQWTWSGGGAAVLSLIADTIPIRVGANGKIVWGSGDSTSTADIGIVRNAAGVLEVNSGTAGTFADLKLKTSYMSTNAMANWPTVAGSPGGCAFVNSNATVYLLTSTPASTAWAATNKLAGP